jgi:hypothetical protein
VNALARCDKTPWIHRTQPVGPSVGYRCSVRRELHSATDTQLWYRRYVTSNTNLQYMECNNNSSKAKASGCNNLHENRFKILVFIFRLGGLPLKLQSVSRINAVYSATIIVCFYITFVSLFMDTFVHRGQLMYAMKKLRTFIGLTMAVWIHLSFR